MMKQFLFVFTAILLDVMGCGPKPEQDNIAVSSSMVGLSHSGGSQDIAITSNTNWKVGVPSSSSWLTISPMEGSGNGTITVSASENTERQRQELLIVKAGMADATIQIIQQGKPLADRVIGTYVGKLSYENEVIEDDFPITVTKISDTAVNVTAAIFDTPQEFNLSEGNAISFSNSNLPDLKIWVTDNTMAMNYREASGFKWSYTGVKK